MLIYPSTIYSSVLCCVCVWQQQSVWKQLHLSHAGRSPAALIYGYIKHFKLSVEQVYCDALQSVHTAWTVRQHVTWGQGH